MGAGASVCALLCVLLSVQGVIARNSVVCELLQSTTIAERVETGHMTGWECFGGEPDAELCEDWSGVKCDRRGNIIQLDISEQDLTGTLPSSIGELKHLQRLYVDSNRLNGTIPSGLSKLDRLATLSLQINGFEGTIPSELGSMSALKALHLDSNKLSGVIPPEIGELALRDLTASNNELIGNLPLTLADISKKARVVDFSYNKLSGVIPVELCLARNLFLIANDMTDLCKEKCLDKRYREGRIHIATRGGNVFKSKEEKTEIQSKRQVWEEEEKEAKEMEDFKKNLRNMINL